MAEPLTITVQGTPNPNAVKFTLNRIIAAQGKTYRDAASAEADWARQLLCIDGVTQLFAFQHFISVSKTPAANWDLVAPQVEAVLRSAFQQDR
ncbi:MAG: NifU N-terminal domain-containing protein [Candidatus Omnitrophica bacterium]|nr:NifU N-terminal domain-containing protein [Candidatus Omnitrophota bacterium]